MMALLIGCNESLSDTYGDFAGNGKIRYVAKCTSVHATPGWERLILEWINGTDATVDKIKIVWSCEDRRDSVLLPSTTTTYELENLTDGTYRFDVCAVDAAGNQSLVESTYGRPYTRDHEVMLAFTRGVVKSFFLKNRMIFFSDQWNENIIELKLKYKDTGGNTQTYLFDTLTSYNSLITIPDVSMNPADTVYVLRKGRVEGCPDEIDFDPVVVSRKKNFSLGFVNAILRRYGYSTDTKAQEEAFEEFIENVEELEFDYDIETFEDVLYCPNLKKLVFAKNRYLYSDHVKEQALNNVMGDIEKSKLILNKANEPDVLGLTIDYYGSETFIPYFMPKLPYMTGLGFSPLPSLEIIEKEAFKIYDEEKGNRIWCSVEDDYAVLDYLMDDNFETAWATTRAATMRTYELKMELLEETEISGVKIGQPNYGKFFDPNNTVKFMPTMISVQTSLDGVTWENVTFVENNTLGCSPAEITLLPIAEGSRRVRHIKISLRDRYDGSSFYSVNLGDILLYK